jgi:hypothetical protein
LKLTDEQKARASNYAALLNMEAWRDLVRVANDEISRSMTSQDSKDASDLNINTVCEERGYRKGIRWVLQEAGRIQEIG